MTTSGAVAVSNSSGGSVSTRFGTRLISRQEATAAERWRVVDGFGGYYEVSDAGSIRSAKERIARRSDGGTRIYPKGRALRGYVDTEGYIGVMLTVKPCKYRLVRLHRLVAAAFCTRRAGQRWVHHKDGNKSNNAASNLEWCTPKEHGAHNSEQGCTPRGERCGSSKLNRHQVVEIRKRYAGGTTQRELAMEFGVRQSQINRIIHRKRWAHVA